MSEFDAVKTLFESDPQLIVRDTSVDAHGEVVRGTYLVLFGAGPETLDDRRWSTIPRSDSDAEYSLPGRAISGDPEGVRLLLKRVQSFVGQKPVIAGRNTDPLMIEFDSVKVDNSVSPPLFFSDFWVEFWSRR